MKKLTTLLLLLISSSAFGNETFIDLHLTTVHEKEGYHDNDENYRIYNDNNFGIGITQQLNETYDLRYGFFKNSHYRTSVYTVIQPSFYLNDNSNPIKYRLGFALGLATGYDDEDSKTRFGRLNIIGWPNIAIGYKKWFVNIGYLPSVVTTLSLQYKFE